MIAPINDAALQAGDVSAIGLCHVAFGSEASFGMCVGDFSFARESRHSLASH